MSHPSSFVTGAGGLSKVPIPRLQKHRSETFRKATINRQNRVSRACLSCRSRKIKCNGLQPRCSNCSDNATPCVYASSRKDRLKTAVSNNQDMIALLQDLRQQVSSSGQDRIDDLLATVIDDVADAAATVQQHCHDEHQKISTEEERGEAKVSADAGSANLGPRDEALMQVEETRATELNLEVPEIHTSQKKHGLDATGQREESSWSPQGEDDTASKRRPVALWEGRNPHLASLMDTSQANLYPDDEISETNLTVDPLELPPFETAERLVQVYMENVHNSFPFLPKRVFLSRFHHYYTSLRRGNPYRMDRKWQATLNLVFAVGAVYSHLISANRCATEKDNLVYHSRACSLSSEDPWWISLPSFPQMQITGLLSFYYLSIGHINRAWTVMGMAMRSGLALGMHIPKEGHDADAAKHESMLETWWALYALERHVSVLTGRPSLVLSEPGSIPSSLSSSPKVTERSIVEPRVGDKEKEPGPRKTTMHPGVMDSSARQDYPYSAGSGPTNAGYYLHSVVNLGEITQGALALYSAKIASGSWDIVQEMIARGNHELEAWASSLPENFNFLHKPSVMRNRYRREQNTLDILYQSTKILITRPCLCRLDRRKVDQSASSNDFNQRAALLCIGAAKSIASLLPYPIADNLVELYQTGPWWQIVHIVTQALVVLLLEVMYESTYSLENRQEMLLSLKKLLRWLHVMRTNNGTAKRAYSASSALLKKLVPMIKIDITDLVNEEETTTQVTADPVYSPPAHAYTPYPDILNPVHETQTRAQSPQLATPNYTGQQQHHSTYDPYPYPYPYHPKSSQHQSSQFNSPAESFYSQSSHHDRDPGIDFDIFESPFPAIAGSSDVRFPGRLVTSYDEQNPLSGLDLADAGHWSRDRQKKRALS